eukprot:jgi/Undpi1/8598/HiC_scaffold_25.g11063.m1
MKGARAVGVVEELALGIDTVPVSESESAKTELGADLIVLERVGGGFDAPPPSSSAVKRQFGREEKGNGWNIGNIIGIRKIGIGTGICVGNGFGIRNGNRNGIGNGITGISI